MMDSQNHPMLSSLSLTDIEDEISKRMAEIKSSNNSIIRRNALKVIGTNILKLHDSIRKNKDSCQVRFIICIIQGCNSRGYDETKLFAEKNEEQGSLSSLGYLLLDIISDEESSELCRERSATCLKDALDAILISLTSECDLISNSAIDALLTSKFICEFYIELCSKIFCRFGFTQNGHLSTRMLSKNGRKETKAFEDTEEIRLILIQITCVLVQILQFSFNLSSNEVGTRDMMLQNIMPIDKMKSKADLIPATDMVCQIIAKSCFLDQYPELKRESCILLKHLAMTFPSVTMMHEDNLMESIIGAPYKSNNLDHVQSSTHSISDCLIRHRHAKTRSLALKTIVEILNCRRLSYISLKQSELLQSEKVDDSYADIGLWNGTYIQSSETSSIEERLITHILPRMEATVLFDHSPSVRATLTDVIGEIFHMLLEQSSSSSPSHKDMLSTFAKLAVILCLGVTDEVDAVKRAGLINMNACAKNWMLQNIDHSEITMKCNDNQDESNKSTPCLIQTIGSEMIINILLSQISDNVSRESRNRHLGVLCFVFESLNVVQHQEEINNNIYEFSEQVMLNVLSRLTNILSESEDDEETFSAALSCARGIGSVASARSTAFKLLSFALANSQDEGETVHFVDEQPKPKSPKHIFVASSPIQIASVVNIISELMQGSRASVTKSDSNEKLYEDLKIVFNALSGEKVIESVYQLSSSALALLSACHSGTRLIIDVHSNILNVSWMHGESNVIIRSIIWCCVSLLGCPGDFNTNEVIFKNFHLLSSSLYQFKSYEALLDLHFDFMLKMLVNDYETKSWENGDRFLLIFDALIRTSSSQSIGKNFDSIIPIFERSLGNDVITSHHGIKLSKEREAITFSTKIFFMALVESIVSRPSFPKHVIEPFTERLLYAVVVPNLVWQVGGMASALRKVSAAVLFSILQSDYSSDMTLFKLSPQILPMLKCNLSDDDASLRELAISSMGIMFDKMPQEGLSEEEIHQLYPALTKCLDDSSQSVRYLSCDTLKSFLQCAPASNYNGTAISYIVDYLFIHLDDPDESFKEKVYHVLLAALNVDVDLVVKGAKSSLLSHTNRHYCDLLLKQPSKSQ